MIFSNGYSLVMLANTSIVYTSSSYSDASGSVSLVMEGAGTSSGADVTLIADPGASATKRLGEVWLRNAGAVAVTVSIAVRAPGPTDHVLVSTELRVGDCMRWGQDQPTPIVTSSSGVPRGPESDSYAAVVRPFFKSGTAAEAAGNWYCTAKDGGVPGAFTVGTPGLAGRAVTGSPPTPEPGSIWLPAPTGKWHLTYAGLASSTAHAHLIFDLVWVNSGIVVTTTTGQTINSVAFPARDASESTAGDGYMIGLLVTAATTNAAAISNSTVTYTNSNGLAGQTATLVAVAGSQIPATAVVGTLVWFTLAAGDTGVQSIQTLTLNTSLVTGSVSLIVARWISTPMSAAANLTGSEMLSNATMPAADPGIPVWTDPALFHCYQATATTASTVAGTLAFVDRT